MPKYTARIERQASPKSLKLFETRHLTGEMANDIVDAAKQAQLLLVQLTPGWTVVEVRLADTER